jgi:hypothetical protein
MTNACVLVGKRERKGLLKVQWYRGEDKMDLKEKRVRHVGSELGPVAVYCEYGHGFQVS